MRLFRFIDFYAFICFIMFLCFRIGAQLTIHPQVLICQTCRNLWRFFLSPRRRNLMAYFWPTVDRRRDDEPSKILIPILLLHASLGPLIKPHQSAAHAITSDSHVRKTHLSLSQLFVHVRQQRHVLYV